MLTKQSIEFMRRAKPDIGGATLVATGLLHKVAAYADSQDARIAELERKAALYDQIMRACGELPDLWEITIHLEKGAGTVSLFDACGNEVEMESDHESMPEDLKDAINHAKSSAGRDLLSDQIGGAA